MGLIEDFIARYRKEFDFYDQAGRLVAQTLDGALLAAGVRAIVTSRAKSVAQLESKCRKREPEKHYTSVDDIYGDIVDLAGVRVALYFPGEREEVDKLVKQFLVLLEAPKVPTRAGATYEQALLGLLGHALPGAASRRLSQRNAKAICRGPSGNSGSVGPNARLGRGGA